MGRGGDVRIGSLVTWLASSQSKFFDSDQMQLCGEEATLTDGVWETENHFRCVQTEKGKLHNAFACLIAIFIACCPLKSLSVGLYTVFKTAHLYLFGSKVDFMMLDVALNLQRPVYKV